MKVLFYIREDYLTNMAGDSVQVLKTREYIEKLGVEVRISSDIHENLAEYDLVHLFNTIRVKDTHRFYINARQAKAKIILTPIFWNYIDYIPKGVYSNLEKIYWEEGNKLRSELFHEVDMILPSSEREMREIIRRYHTQKPYQIIPNGVDEIFANGVKEDFEKEYKVDNYVLSVGRICRHKNQLSLAYITSELKLPLVLVGPVNDLKYYHSCLKANPNLIYLSKVQHQKLASIYKGAKVHALVSWYEIPGLVNLEAALAGCNIVTTRAGSTKDYFKNYVDYADSNNLEEIKMCIKTAMKKDKVVTLSNYIKENYLWQRVAEKLFKVYKDLLNEK